MSVTSLTAEYCQKLGDRLFADKANTLCDSTGLKEPAIQADWLQAIDASTQSKKTLHFVHSMLKGVKAICSQDPARAKAWVEKAVSYVQTNESAPEERRGQFKAIIEACEALERAHPKISFLQARKSAERHIRLLPLPQAVVSVPKPSKAITYDTVAAAFKAAIDAQEIIDDSNCTKIFTGLLHLAHQLELQHERERAFADMANYLCARKGLATTAVQAVWHQAIEFSTHSKKNLCFVDSLLRGAAKVYSRDPDLANRWIEEAVGVQKNKSAPKERMKHLQEIIAQCQKQERAHLATKLATKLSQVRKDAELSIQLLAFPRRPVAPAPSVVASLPPVLEEAPAAARSKRRRDEPEAGTYDAFAVAFEQAIAEQPLSASNCKAIFEKLFTQAKQIEPSNERDRAFAEMADYLCDHLDLAKTAVQAVWRQAIEFSTHSNKTFYFVDSWVKGLQAILPKDIYLARGWVEEAVVHLQENRLDPKMKMELFQKIARTCQQMKRPDPKIKSILEKAEQRMRTLHASEIE